LLTREVNNEPLQHVQTELTANDSGEGQDAITVLR
jgi:hypothetical protein